MCHGQWCVLQCVCVWLFGLLGGMYQARGPVVHVPALQTKCTRVACASSNPAVWLLALSIIRGAIVRLHMCCSSDCYSLSQG